MQKAPQILIKLFVKTKERNNINTRISHLASKAFANGYPLFHNKCQAFATNKF